VEQIRSFIAIELPEELKLELTQLEARLKSGQHSGIKWVDPYGIHLTLKFLGSIAAGVVGDITRVMEESVQGRLPFRLEVKNLGGFPNMRRTQVAWVGIKGELDKLAQLQQRIESNLTQLGFTPESRAFTPHLTLARLRPQVALNDRQRFGQLIVDTEFVAVKAIAVDTINLMRSELTREGAIYSRISSVALR
jgi:2'-5' RNA ligase